MNHEVEDAESAATGSPTMVHISLEREAEVVSNVIGKLISFQLMMVLIWSLFNQYVEKYQVRKYFLLTLFFYSAWSKRKDILKVN